MHQAVEGKEKTGRPRLAQDITEAAFKDSTLIQFHAWYTQYSVKRLAHVGRMDLPSGVQMPLTMSSPSSHKVTIEMVRLNSLLLSTWEKGNQTPQHDIRSTTSQTFSETFIMSPVFKTQQGNQNTPWCMCSLSWGNTQFNLCKPNK